MFLFPQSSYSQDEGSVHPRSPLCLSPDVLQQLPGQPVLSVGEPPSQTSRLLPSLLLLSSLTLLAGLCLAQQIVEHFWSLSSSLILASLRFNYTGFGNIKSGAEVTNKYSKSVVSITPMTRSYSYLELATLSIEY